MDNADSNPVVDNRGIFDVIKPDQGEGIRKTGVKKLKTETEKGTECDSLLKKHIFE